MSLRPEESQTSGWVTYADKLEALVKWLAMPFGDNVPIFAKALPDGRPLETGIMMEALYKEVMGPKDYEPTAGHWVQCQSCMQMHVERPDLTEETPYCGRCIQIADEWNEHRNTNKGHTPTEAIPTVQGYFGDRLASAPPA